MWEHEGSNGDTNRKRKQMRGNDIAVIGKIYSRDKSGDFLSFSAGGVAYAPFNLSCWSHKDKDDDTNQYISYQCIVFGDLAENMAESIEEGDTVIVTGRMQANNWTDDDSNKHYDNQLVVDEIGVSLRWDTVSINRVERSTPKAKAKEEAVF